MPKYYSVSAVLFVWYASFFVSLAFSLRAISSMSVGLILITGIIKNRLDYGRFFHPRLRNPLVILCCLFFLLQMASLLYSTNVTEGWSRIRIKSAIVALPLALCCCDFIEGTTRKHLLNFYCLILSLSCAVALGYALRQYAITGNVSALLYHSLVAVYAGHAILFSILVVTALVHLVEMALRKEPFFSRVFHAGLILFLSVFLFLLSSKLVLTFFILYLVVAIGRALHRRVSKAIVVCSVATVLVFVALIFTIPNPIYRRFKEILGTDFTILKKERFSPADYFNGLQFRMLQWRFVPEILNQQKAWLTGVSVADAQARLDAKYVSTNMYIGEPARGDRGFLGYNTHNEFLESLLQTGIAGLALFLSITAALARMAWRCKSMELRFVVLLFIVYSLNESVFETQYSILIFLFFPLFLYLDKKDTAP